jgi:HEAT repeat protein
MRVLLLFAVAIAALATRANAATPPRRYAKLSDQALAERVSSMDSEAILETGIRGNKDQVPFLEKLASSDELPKEVADRNLRGDSQRDARVKEFMRPQHVAARRSAKMALARMGETQHLKEFVGDLSSSDGWKRIYAIRALGYAGDKRAAKYLGPILNEQGGPRKVSKHELAPSYAETAEQALGQLFPEVQAGFEKESAHRFFFADEWKAWWKQNRDKYTEDIR